MSISSVVIRAPCGVAGCAAGIYSVGRVYYAYVNVNQAASANPYAQSARRPGGCNTLWRVLLQLLDIVHHLLDVFTLLNQLFLRVDNLFSKVSAAMIHPATSYKSMISAISDKDKPGRLPQDQLQPPGRAQRTPAAPLGRAEHALLFIKQMVRKVTPNSLDNSVMV